MSMTPLVANGATPVTAEMRTHLRNRISWGAVLAGVAAALVVQLLLNVLGIGLGASALSVTNAADNPTASGFSIWAGIWWTVSGIVASGIGGVVAGRLSGTADGNTARWHGLVSWCAATLVVFYLLTSALGGILGGTFNALSGTIGAAGRGAASAVTGLAQNTDGDALQAQARRLVNPTDAQSLQANVITYLRASLNGNKAAASRAQDDAVNAVAKSADISPDEARGRLLQTEQQMAETLAEARQKAEQAAQVARQSAATAGIFGFFALLLGAGAAWIGGALGAPRLETETPGGRLMR
jgi:hypothetical protein